MEDATVQDNSAVLVFPPGPMHANEVVVQKGEQNEPSCACENTSVEKTLENIGRSLEDSVVQGNSAVQNFPPKPMHANEMVQQGDQSEPSCENKGEVVQELVFKPRCGAAKCRTRRTKFQL